LWNEIPQSSQYTGSDIVNFDTVKENDILSKTIKDGRVALLCGIYDPHIVIPLKEPIAFSSENDNVLMSITYKSNVTDSLQLFYNYGSGFYELNSTHYMIEDTNDDFITVYIPINDRSGGKSLLDIRIDPPNGSVFEFRDLKIVTSNLPRGAVLDSDISENYDFKLLPYVWANFDEKVKKQMPATLLEFPPDLYLEDSIPMEIPINGDYIRDKGNYLYLVINSPEDNKLKIIYGASEKNQISMNILPGQNKYLVRISVQYNWMNEPQKELLVLADKSLTVKEMAILEGD
jgi:hypothetical protein